MKQLFINLLLIAGIIFIHYMCKMAHTNLMYLFALLGGTCIGFYTDCVYKERRTRNERFEASVIMFMVMAIMLIFLFGVISIISTLNDIKQQHEDIEDNILDDLRDIRIAQELSKTSPNVPVSPPCYAPNGICTNPQMDCINCPKRSSSGTWSTGININKEE